ncbi:hypothetical protein [Halobaculum sp. P14]|uniref:hypothetical protein n=1 Tax=Halobaculum sp. P14 TaxID=3421638 RepID=UPI003EBCE4F6
MTDDGAPSAVTWEFAADADPVVRTLLLAGFGLLAGPVVALLAALTWAAFTAALGGDFTLVAAAAAVVAVGIALNRAQLAALRESDVSLPAVGRWRAAAALLVGAGVHAAAAALGVPPLWPLLGLGAALAVLAGLLAGEGSVDPAAGTVEYAGVELPVDSVRSLRSLRVGDRVAVLLRFRPGVPESARYATFSAAAFDAAEPLLRPTDPDDEPDSDPDRLPRPVRTVAALFGVGCLGVGAAVLLVAPRAGNPVAVYAAAFAGLFGGVFLWYATTG